MMKKCAICGKEFRGRKEVVSCSKECGYKVLSQKMKKKGLPKNWHPKLGFKKGKKHLYYGKRSPHQKEKVELYGYIYVWNPNHPAADCRKRVAEHRLVMENKIGRHLRKDEVVHHKNGNKKDNSKDNLELMTKSKHTKLHNNIRNEQEKTTRNNQREP